MNGVMATYRGKILGIKLLGMMQNAKEIFIKHL